MLNCCSISLQFAQFHSIVLSFVRANLVEETNIDVKKFKKMWVMEKGITSDLHDQLEKVLFLLLLSSFFFFFFFFLLLFPILVNFSQISVNFSRCFFFYTKLTQRLDLRSHII